MGPTRSVCGNIDKRVVVATEVLNHAVQLLCQLFCWVKPRLQNRLFKVRLGDWHSLSIKKGHWACFVEVFALPKNKNKQDWQLRRNIFTSNMTKTLPACVYFIHMIFSLTDLHGDAPPQGTVYCQRCTSSHGHRSPATVHRCVHRPRRTPLTTTCHDRPPRPPPATATAHAGHGAPLRTPATVHRCAHRPWRTVAHTCRGAHRPPRTWPPRAPRPLSAMAHRCIHSPSAPLSNSHRATATAPRPCCTVAQTATAYTATAHRCAHRQWRMLAVAHAGRGAHRPPRLGWSR